MKQFLSKNKIMIYLLVEYNELVFEANKIKLLKY